MRNIARMLFDKDAPLSFLFYPLYYMAELIVVGFRASEFTRRKDQGVQTLESEAGLSVELLTGLKDGRNGLRPTKVEAMTVFWQGETLVRFVGLAFAFNRLVKLVGQLQGEAFPDVLERVSALQSKKVVVRGTSAQEVVEGGDENDVIRTFGGDDSIVATRGKDKINGGAGDDVYLGNILNLRLIVDLVSDVARKKGGGRDEIKRIEDVRGSSKSDVIRGDGGENQLAGDGGADRILGRAGADTIFGGDGAVKLFGGGGDVRLFGDAGRVLLFGGSGADLLFGGEGADEFVINPSEPGGPDVVDDYDHAQGDRLRLPGAAADYVLQAVDDNVLVRQAEGGEVVAVLPDDVGSEVLDDAFYGL